MHAVALDEQDGAPRADDDPYFRFFRGLPGPPGRPGRPNQPDQSDPRDPGGVPLVGTGSGFLISPDGLVLTNAHVVRQARDVLVTLSDRRDYPARVLGLDMITDVAVLRIDAQGLPAVRLGDVSQLEVGDPVLAIGAPYSLEQTATKGIVSAKGRSLPGGAVVPFLQTDAAVNPGSSGGPLFDGSGAVVGINVPSYSRGGGGFQGLSFAIPINVALKVKDQIVATGRAVHARLGVSVQDLNPALAESFGLKRPDAALVADVAAHSAAAAAGLRAGDVILQVNGQAIGPASELSGLIGLASPGEHVKLQVWRDARWRDIEATLGTAQDGAALVDARAASTAAQPLGLVLRPLTAPERRQANVDHGLRVDHVDGAAARAGVLVGDVLIALNGQPLQSVDQVNRVLRTQPKSLTLLLQRDGETIFVPVRLG